MGKVIVKGDVPDSLAAEVIGQEILGIAKPRYRLHPYSRTYNLGTRIVAKMPIGTKLVGEEKVPEFVESAIDAQSYTDLDFTCWKNVVHVGVSLEAELASRISIMNQQVKDAANAVARMENKQIAEELCGADQTELAATLAWGTPAANDPLIDIMAAVDAINTNDWMADTFLMSLQVYKAFATNDDVRLSYERGVAIKAGHIPSVIGLKIVLDNKLGYDATAANESSVVMDSKAPNSAYADGPTVVTKYNGNARFMDAYAVAKFIQPKIALAEAGRELTSCIT